MAGEHPFNSLDWLQHHYTEALEAAVHGDRPDALRTAFTRTLDSLNARSKPPALAGPL